MNANKEDCIVFEDSLAGIKAANLAGMISIGIGSKQVLKKADYVFNDFTEINLGFSQNLLENEN